MPLTVTNQKVYTALDFNVYKSLPGLSFSKLRQIETGQKEIVTTPKMHFGTLVDAYLFTPEKYSGEMLELVRPIAAAVKQYIGANLLARCEPQISVTADFNYDGYVMPYTGRPDLWLKIMGIVIDLKVSEIDVIAAAKHFKYRDQLSGYALALGANMGLLLSANPKTKKVTPLMVQPDDEWWRRQVLKHGQRA